MKKIKIICVGFLLSGLLAIVFSPIPVSWFINKLFDGGVETNPVGFSTSQKKIKIKKNINYQSKHSNGYLDIYSPKEINEQTKPILWVHGGAYVGGDKSDITMYATQLAANNYIVISMNYGLAPTEKYPVPLIQIGEVYSYLKKNRKNFSLDIDHLYFAGDSAGAQIVSQYITAQSNEKYANYLTIPQKMSIESVAGILLFCGPYELQKLGEIGGDNVCMNFLIKRIGWAYIGEYNWEKSTVLKTADIFPYLTSKFPSTFITDGNTGSFESQGKTLATQLQKQSVKVSSLFYDQKEGKISHEYQFKLDTVAGENTFSKVIKFLNENK